MKRLTAIAVVLVASGCGSSGIEGTLAWRGQPVVAGRAVNGSVGNTTSHSVTLDPKSMRLLDADGRKVKGRIRLGATRLAPHASTTLRATWTAGKPVRIDYGTGALALPSG